LFFADVIDKVSSVSGDIAVLANSEISLHYDAYVTSLYWATATITSTGYGDVPPKTIGEKIYAITTMIVGKYRR